MPFSPVNTRLGTVDELENFSYSIVYTSPLGISSTNVVITTNMPNPTVSISGNTISGFFSEVFTSNTISYWSRARTLETTSSWTKIEEAIAVSSVLEIYDWSPDPTPSKSYYYTATAGGESQEYDILVLNNWDTGKNQLLYYIDLTRRVYVPVFGSAVRWININARTVTWINDNLTNTSVTWINGR